MTRPLPRRIAVCLAAGLVTTLLSPSAPAAHAVDDAAEPAPLAVSIDALTPSAVPRRGRVTVTGSVTNTSGSTWTDLQVYLLTSAEPIRDSDELEAAATTDPTVDIGARITRPGRYAEIGDLAPGASTHYTLSIPRSDLDISGDPGVYWLGVHVLGASDDGRDGVADGRARTFLPLMRPRGPRASLALVVPIKGTVRRHPDGTLANVERWQRAFGGEGRLGRLLQMSATSPVPVTWVVDPAVLDAARAIAAENPPMSIGPTDEAAADRPTPSSGPAGSSTPFPSDGPTDPAPPARLSPAATDALTWLDEFTRQAGFHTVLTVPYGDLDLASARHGDFARAYQQARTLSTETMTALDVESAPVVAPPTGFLPPETLPLLDPATPVLLPDTAAPAATVPVLGGAGTPPVVLMDSSAATGGPSPTPRFAALAVRQRILSEAALRALSADATQPLVVSTPQMWDPGTGWRESGFFAGLDVDWLQPVGLPGAAADRDSGDPAADDPRAQLVYPRRQRAAELPRANLQATRELTRTGNVLAGLLLRNDLVDEFLAKSALLASSVHARRDPVAARNRALATDGAVHRIMAGVEIDAPPFVTMSSEKGSFQVTLVNNLEEPVAVGLRAQTGSDNLVIDAPDTVELAPGARASLRLRAHATDIGVHSVTLSPTNADGAVLGNGTRFSVRSSQVGLVIWVIMGLGAGVLFLAIAIRVVRRLRARRGAPGPLLPERP